MEQDQRQNNWLWRTDLVAVRDRLESVVQFTMLGDIVDSTATGLSRRGRHAGQVVGGHQAPGSV